MTWTEISVQVDGEAAEAVHELFNRYCHGGAVIEELFSLDEDAAPPQERHLVVKAFLPHNGRGHQDRQQLMEGLWHLGQIYPIPSPTLREVAERDWAEAWREGYGVQRIGQCFVIAPSWLEYVSSPGEVVIELDPGMAFGTGTHPSTRGCLRRLERLVAPGDRVLDVGTGSGILAIAAARLGASRVLALDIDSTAVKVARDNIRVNGVGEVVTVREGSLPSHEPQRSWDLVVINILPHVVADLADDLADCLDSGACLIAGGIIEEKQHLVTEAFAAAGLQIDLRQQERDWLTLIASRLPPVEDQGLRTSD